LASKIFVKNIENFNKIINDNNIRSHNNLRNILRNKK
jgi:hypothetical protein